MLIRVDYPGLLDLPILTRYQYIAIVGEKVSCVFLINHYLSLDNVLYKITVFILSTDIERKLLRAQIVKNKQQLRNHLIEIKSNYPFKTVIVYLVWLITLPKIWFHAIQDNQAHSLYRGGKNANGI
ncbi:TPA: hypothetical protein L9U43_003616 [Klebsiella pneumoniae]|uniref:hypothetical protein n=1 Tax=Klebsiella pneumoniae TaxID=573 RepID=UPI002499B6CD|nr:hypothetical protein [Klebsiella pneumoniae]MDI2663361.1 hypothetical protein [Klebsiella pneumoniae]HBR4105328.1 hypothetical protein [Klebsiella pneumoniae]